MDGGALVVTVLIAVLDRDMHVHVHAATTWTSWVLTLDRSDLEAAAFNDKVSPSQPTHETTKKKSNVA